MTPDEIRKLALEMAIKNCGGLDADTVVKQAKIFEAYLLEKSQ